MDDIDLQKHIKKVERGAKIHKYVDRVFKSLLIAPALCLLIYGSAELKSNFFSKRIYTNKQLQTLLAERKGKMKLGDVPVRAQFGDKHSGPSVYPSIEGDYVMTLRKGDTVDTLDHELFHVYADKKGKRYEGGGLMQILKEELPADIYASFGIKLK